MAWQDRPYYRDRYSGRANPLMWLVSGSVSLGTWFGIHVRMHAMMLVFIVWTIVFRSFGTWQDSVESMAILFGIVLLHEFGHCYGSYLVGGQPSSILMTPLGGLAFVDAPRRPWANFVTVLFGPLVNVLICVLATVGMMMIAGTWRLLPWNPFAVNFTSFLNVLHRGSELFRFFGWVFAVSYALLLFNLWPVFPLDGGQLLQSLLWVKFGYFKATLFASVTGMVGAGIFGVLGLMSQSWLIVFIALSGFLFCLSKYRELKANGPWAYEDEFDYSSSYREPGRRKTGDRKLRRAQRMEREAAAEQERIDVILAKVSAQGMQSLTWWEKRTLRKATQHQRERDLEMSRSRRS